MSELYISGMTLRESRPRSKRLLGLGSRSMSVSSSNNNDALNILFSDLFERVEIGQDSDNNPIYAIHAKYALYSDGDITAGGRPESESEPEPVAAALYQLTDVAKSSDGEHVGQTAGGLPATVGQVLGFNGTSWVAMTVPGGGGGSLESLTDVQLASKDNYDILAYHGGKWKDFSFQTFVDQWSLLSQSDDARITGSWVWPSNNPIQFTDDIGTVQIFGRKSGTAHDLYISASSAIRLISDHVYINNVEITGGGGGGGSTVSWNQIVTSGTKIATITINGTTKDVFAPTSGGGGTTVSWGSESQGSIPLTVGSTAKTLMLSAAVSWGTESGGGVPLTIKGTSKTLALKSALSSYLPLAGGTMTGNILPNSTSVNLGSSAKPWGEIHANKWYPKASDTTHYIEYTTNGFLIHGNIIANGAVTAGA